MPRPAALYNRRKWQLIGKSQWCCSANCGHPLHALTYNWTRGMQRFLAPTIVSPHPPNGISIGSSVLAQYISVTNTQTRRPRYVWHLWRTDRCRSLCRDLSLYNRCRVSARDVTVPGHFRVRLQRLYHPSSHTIIIIIISITRDTTLTGWHTKTPDIESKWRQIDYTTR